MPLTTQHKELLTWIRTAVREGVSQRRAFDALRGEGFAFGNEAGRVLFRQALAEERARTVGPLSDPHRTPPGDTIVSTIENLRARYVYRYRVTLRDGEGNLSQVTRGVLSARLRRIEGLLPDVAQGLDNTPPFAGNFTIENIEFIGALEREAEE